MHKTLLAGASAIALIMASAGGATAASHGMPDLSGQTLTISGPWLTADKDSFDVIIKMFEDATGATVEHAGSDSFEQQIIIDTQAGSAPNLAIFPQPGLAANLASKGL